MLQSNKLTINGCRLFIVSDGFEFTHQSCVKFYGKRLSKQQLIKCCNHFIDALKVLGYSDILKAGFNLKCFKYFELSVYLHGLISLYCSHLDYDCPPCFGLVRFSHLPHDVLKTEKKTVVVECACLHDYEEGTLVFVAFCNILFSSKTFVGLKSLVRHSFPSSQYTLVFKLFNELPF